MKTVKLNSLCSQIVDCSHQTPVWLNEGIFVIRNYNLINGQIDKKNASYVDETTYQNRTKRAIPESGDIIISREAPMGAVGMIPEGMKCCLGQRLVLLKVNMDKCDAGYLLYMLQSYYVQNQIRQIDKTGSIVSNLNIPDLKKLDIPHVDMLIQKKISKILSTLDKKININNQIIEELEIIAKELYDYWFIQFDFPNSKGKPYRSSGGEMIYDKTLKRKIPKGWEIKQLKSILGFYRGISYTSKNIKNKDGLPMINLGSIDINRNYRPGQLKFYSGKYKQEDIVKKGDMLIACTDLTRNCDIIGSPIIVPEEFEEYLYTMDLAKINIADEISDVYIYESLRTNTYHNYIKHFASGTNVLHLDLNGINWYKLEFPPKNLQEQFSKIIKPIRNKQLKIISENQNLALLRNFLLPLLMNGQVKVAV